MEQLITFVLSLALLIVFFFMASNVSKISKSVQTTEAILKRLLEMEKERDNKSNAAEQLGSTRGDE